MRLKASALILFSCLIALVNAGCSSSSTTSSSTGGGGTTPGGTTTNPSAIIANHFAVDAFDLNLIPPEYISQSINNFRIYYGHTSHGSQIITGLEMLQNSIYNHNGLEIEEIDDDLGGEGNTYWTDTTRERLNEAGNNINLVMWSWCGGVEDSTEANINAYLNAMNQLEQDYPNIKFVYMTGHLSSSNQSNLLARNQQIRDYCNTYNKVLFDFADIESYDPDDNPHLSDTDACEWCTTWCASHTCPSCGEADCCAHSHDFNCYRKGKAFWWMLARLSGWNGS